VALTRAMLLAGNSSQGIVLPNQVQGVRQGVGLTILPDGTINFDATTASGVMRLNNAGAYNAYVWPALALPPAAGTILQSDGTGAVNWTANYVPTTGVTGAGNLPVGTIAQRPTGTALAAGQIRYNSETGALEYYSGAGWVSVVAITPSPGPNPTIGLGLAVSGTAIKLSVPIQFGPPLAGTLPAEAIPGSLYWDDNLGLLFIYYYDGTSYQWVQVTPSGGGGGSGTVTSVGLASAGVASGIAVTGATSPITTSGTYNLAIDVANLPLLP
jgi:hypothetical protein